MTARAPPDSTDAFKAQLTAVIPHLRAFARSLCHNRTHADDLAQEALLKAWNARESFVEGTNFKSWTFTILRNLYYSERRRSWRSTGLDPEVAEATLVAADDPSASLDLLATRNALMKLPDEYREAVILVGAGGLSYEEAAAIAGTAIGTMKSRVSRARKALAKLIDDNQSGYSDDGSVRGHQVFEGIMTQVDVLTGVASKRDQKR